MDYTIKQAAEKLGKSKSTIKYHLNKLDQEQREAYLSSDLSGVIHINPAGFVHLCAVFGQSEPDSDTKPDEPDQTALVPAEQVQTLTAMLGELSAQLRAKDDQIRQQQELLQQQADQISQLIDQQKPRRTFWQWIRRKA